MSKSWKEIELEELKKKQRNEQIKTLALSTLKEMIKLEFTNEEYEYFKTCMDKKLKIAKINL